MTVRMGYASWLSVATIPQLRDTLSQQRRSAPRPDYAGVRVPGRNDIRKERQKRSRKFKLCENGEEPFRFLSLSISKGGAPHSEYRTASSTGVCERVKSRTQRQSRTPPPADRASAREIGTESRFHENNALQRNGLAYGQANYTTGRTKKGGFYTMKMR